MAERQSTKKPTERAAESTAAADKTFTGLTVEERAAMKERTGELKTETRSGRKKEDGEADVLAKIDDMEEPDRSMATRLHEIIKDNAPTLSAKTWYGMPAYAK